MKTPQTRPGTRRGFTLIELLIVIAIIGVILSLIAAAVVQAQRKGRQTGNRIDIGQLEVAIEQFKQKFGAYPPSRIRLCESLAYYDLSVNASGQPVNQVDTDSVQFITQMFPRIDWSTGINWTGSLTFPNPAPAQQGVDGPGAITLEGDQCLVFFLGGIPNAVLPPACLGFSSNPKNPAAITQDRIGPFFEFDSKRLVLLRISANPYNRYYSYADAYCTTDGNGTLIPGSGLPYAYFSSYKNPSGYMRYFTFFQLGLQPPYPLGQNGTLPFNTSDCASLAVYPYFESATPLGNKYLKPNSFQIISAGLDGQFGAGGGPWNATTGGSYYPNGPGGYDDQANFTGSLIGAGPN
jgi:prepilin-type N-terminal cleavage/methylation domain-containing protein